MPHAHASASTAVNLPAELEYWRGVHASGRLGGRHGVDDYLQMLQLGYRVYLAYPNASEAQLYRVLQDSYHRHQPVLSVPWEEARWLIRNAWHHLRDGEGATRLH